MLVRMRSEEALERSGLRLTKQRQLVYDVLLEKKDHPTATEVFFRSKEAMPSISLATVYNCLVALTEYGLIRQVNFDRAPTRYCPTREEHGHFHCDICGRVFDVHLEDEGALGRICNLPKNYFVTCREVTLRGQCPDCYQKKS